MGLVMFRRTRHGEKAFTDRDWRLVFGKSKAEVLIAHYGSRLLLTFVGCALLGVVEYLIFRPYGFTWYGVGVVLTAIVILILTPRVLR